MLKSLFQSEISAQQSKSGISQFSRRAEGCVHQRLLRQRYRHRLGLGSKAKRSCQVRIQWVSEIQTFLEFEWDKTVSNNADF